MFGNGSKPTDIDTRTRNAAGAPANGALSPQAVSDADAYFSSVGSTQQQMAAMRIDGGDDLFGGGGGGATGYVVSAHAPQAVMQPAQGAGSNGDLLVL